MRKSVVALAAIIALGSLPVASDAFAAHGGGHGGGHFGGGHFGGHTVAHSRQVGRHGPHVGGGHPARFVRGHDRHFWHGRWWTYGVGPCWAWSDDYAEYVWVCF
jgi:hypothetical protein